jgi:hypothetical protein
LGGNIYLEECCAIYNGIIRLGKNVGMGGKINFGQHCAYNGSITLSSFCA